MRRITAGAAAVACALGLAACSGTGAPVAHAFFPVVNSFKVSSSSVPSSGGTVLIQVSVLHANSCQIRSSIHVKGLPTKQKCKSGSLSVSVVIPPSKAPKARSWVFHLDAFGAGGEVSALPVVVQQRPPGPHVVSFSVSPPSLTAAGGRLTLTGFGEYGRYCEFDVSPLIRFFPLTLPCGHSASKVVRIPPNYTKKARTFTFAMSVFTKVSQKKTRSQSVTESAIGQPGVTSFSASTTSLPSSGGAVTLNASVVNALGCHFAASGGRKIVGLPKWVLCGSGTASVTATVPANKATHTVTYRFQMSANAHGLHAKSAVLTLTEAGVSKPPPTPKPTFNFSVVAQNTPVPATGGQKTLMVQNLTNATNCTFSASSLPASAPAVIGLPKTESCTSSASDTVTIPANPTTSPETYTFFLQVTGPGGKSPYSKPKAVTVDAKSAKSSLPTTTTTTTAAAARATSAARATRPAGARQHPAARQHPSSRQHQVAVRRAAPLSWRRTASSRP